MANQVSNVFSGGIDPGITGSGKRAYYSLCSYQTTNNSPGVAFYGPNMNSVVNVGYESGYNNYGPSHITYINDSTNQVSACIFSPVVNSVNPVSTNSGNYLNGVNHGGEFGHALYDAYSDGTINNVNSRILDSSVKHYLNSFAINSDHLNKRIVYILTSGVIRAVDRLYGSHSYSMAGMTDFTVSSLTSSMQGSASYHRARKELTILSYASSGGSFNCFTYQNVDFDAYPSPSVALSRPEVVRVDATLSLASNWQTNNNESYYNLKPITTDNGNVYVSVFFSSTGFYLYRFTRSGTSAITGTYIANQAVTTSYGRDQGIAFGQRQITSRDGTSVATFCPYYYYGSGVRCYMIDKTNNTYTAYGNADTTNGVQCIPYGDSSWMFYYAGNGYAGNYTGAYIISQYIKQGGASGGHVNQNGCYYIPYWPVTNTTNYPGMGQVVDYMLLPSHLLGAKNT
jgi:hypothetical protein